MIPYGHQSINDNDIDAVIGALKSEWLTTGPFVDQFESEIEKIVAAPSITVTSGTAALHCAYAAIEIQNGDEIITPPITFIATQATAYLLGAKIVFADVLPDTANLDPISVESAITSKTKAIVAVDYAGHPADMDELRNISDRYGLYLIEDASHSIGSFYKEKPVGSLADITTFSFFPTKNITTAEGGAVSSLNSELLHKAKMFARQGLIRDTHNFKIKSEGFWHQEVHKFGLNYRLPDILCALGISQLKRIWEFKNSKNKIFDFYNTNLANLDWLKTPVKRNYVDPNWHLYPVQVRPEFRSKFMSYLQQFGINTRVNYLPAYRHPVFNYPEEFRQSFRNSENFYAKEVSLPMFSDLSSKNMNKIVSIILEFDTLIKNNIKN